MNRPTVWLSSAGAGAAAACLLDPVSGRRRRARLRDMAARITHGVGHGAAKAGRDLRNRTRGTAVAATRWLRRDEPDDAVLVERVRAALGRIASHPHAIAVHAQDRTVTLAGPIPSAEEAALVSAVQSVPGIRRVENHLELHRHAENIPALQGGMSPPRLPTMLDVRQRNWAPATRVLIGGAALAAVGLGAKRGGARGVALTATGAALFARAATNLELARLFGIGATRRAVDLQKTITVAVPVEQAFAFWDEFGNFPQFMTHVREISPTHNPRQWHWIVDGPAGVPVEFDAVVTERIPNQLLGWKTVEGSSVSHAGLVRFDRTAPSSTRVHIRMSYNPPGGAVMHGVLALLGADPKGRIDDDLVRMKTALETGRRPHDAAQPEER